MKYSRKYLRGRRSNLQGASARFYSKRDTDHLRQIADQRLQIERDVQKRNKAQDGTESI